MLVILEMALIAALWGIAFRQLAATSRALDYLNQSNPTQLGTNQTIDAYKPLARALSLLETGDPPDGGSGVYVCNTTIMTTSGPTYFLITYQRQDGTGNNEVWTVTASQAFPDPSEAPGWDNMPSTFASGQ